MATDCSISYRSPTKEEYPEVLKAFTEYFINNEPGYKSLGGCPDGLPKCLEERYTNFLRDGVSVIAYDDKEQVIAGVMISILMTREKDGMSEKPTYEELCSKLNEKAGKINVVCNDSIHASDFYASHPEFQKTLDLFAIGVNEKYQRKGIATKLVQESIKVK